MRKGRCGAETFDMIYVPDVSRSGTSAGGGGPGFKLLEKIRRFGSDSLEGWVSVEL